MANNKYMYVFIIRIYVLYFMYIYNHVVSLYNHENYFQNVSSLQDNSRCNDIIAIGIFIHEKCL